MNYKIIDNFLEKESLNNLNNIFESKEELPWFYRENMVGSNDNHYFTHSFYNYHTIRSPFFSLVEPILKKLNAISLIEVRANLFLKGEIPYESSWHTDYNYSNSKTAILYLTTCNAKTILDKEKQYKIDSIENRILIFDCLTLHKVICQTDKKRRIIININYFS